MKTDAEFIQERILEIIDERDETSAFRYSRAKVEDALAVFLLHVGNETTLIAFDNEKTQELTANFLVRRGLTRSDPPERFVSTLADFTESDEFPTELFVRLLVAAEEMIHARGDSEETNRRRLEKGGLLQPDRKAPGVEDSPPTGALSLSEFEFPRRG